MWKCPSSVYCFWSNCMQKSLVLYPLTLRWFPRWCSTSIVNGVCYLKWVWVNIQMNNIHTKVCIFHSLFLSSHMQNLFVLHLLSPAVAFFFFFTVSGSGRVHLINWLMNLCFFFSFFWGKEENSMPEPARSIKVLKADVYFLWSIRQANQLTKLHTWSINRPWASLVLKELKHQVKRVVSPFWWKKNGTSLTEEMEEAGS